MEWSALPLSARNVLEWLDNPHTGARKTLTFERGKLAPCSGVMLTAEVFDAVHEYADTHRKTFEVFDITDDMIRLKLP